MKFLSRILNSARFLKCRVLTFLAQVLASDENPRVRDGNAALAMAAKANDLTGGVQPAMLDAMAMAYAEIGQFTNAQRTAADAIKLATAYDMTNDVPSSNNDCSFTRTTSRSANPSSSPTRRLRKWNNGVMERWGNGNNFGALPVQYSSTPMLHYSLPTSARSVRRAC
jgi:hypothetical protein